MPKVLQGTPAWLVRPSPGAKVFQQSEPVSIQSSNQPVPLAYRNTEIFAAVRNEIRWADLVMLKELASREKDSYKRSAYGLEDAQPQFPYRALRVNVAREIKRLIVSPNGELLVIVTSHTVHVAILPDSSHLGTATDSAATKLKCFQLGPTDHVLERAPVAAALWHPLGAHGNCLVTVTADAIVRLWELDAGSRHTFDRATTAVDLKKLANASASVEDMSPSRFATSRSFSPDDFELEVASACFGGTGNSSETCWSAMTLWIAMRGGDIYCLCPLLPSKWQPTPGLITTVLSNIALKHESTEVKTDQSLVKQLTWASDIDKQAKEVASETSVFERPTHTSSVPMLQGPMRITPDADEVFDVTDIFVIPGKERDDEDDIGFVAQDEHEGKASLPINTVVVGTSDGYVHVLLDIEGVEARWLPAKGPKIFSPIKRQQSAPELVLIDSPLVRRPGKRNSDARLVFTRDAVDHNGLFVSHIGGVHHLDFSSWTSKLAEEMDGTEAGLAFRLDLLFENARTHVTEIIHTAIRKRLPSREHNLYPVSNKSLGEDIHDAESEEADFTAVRDVVPCINLSDADLGHFLLASHQGQQHAATLDDPTSFSLSASSTSDYAAIEPEEQTKFTALDVPVREAYNPPETFWAESQLPTIPNNTKYARLRQKLRVKDATISPLAVDFFIDVHKTLSVETDALLTAASELFRNCVRLRTELNEQIKRGIDVSDRIESVIDADADEYPRQVGDSGDHSQSADVGINSSVDRRMDAVKTRQADIEARYAALREKQTRLSGRPLSDKERGWIRSVDELTRAVCGADEDQPDETADDATAPYYRLQQIKVQAQDVLGRARKHIEKMETEAGEEVDDLASAMSGLSIPAERRNDRREQVEALLERESAVIDATRAKVELLSGWGMPGTN